MFLLSVIIIIYIYEVVSNNVHVCKLNLTLLFGNQCVNDTSNQFEMLF